MIGCDCNCSTFILDFDISFASFCRIFSVVDNTKPLFSDYKANNVFFSEFYHQNCLLLLGTIRIAIISNWLRLYNVVVFHYLIDLFLVGRLDTNVHFASIVLNFLQNDAWIYLHWSTICGFGCNVVLRLPRYKISCGIPYKHEIENRFRILVYFH